MGGTGLSSCPSPAPTPNVHSNSKSNMSSQINGHRLIALARPNEMPALQARICTKLTKNYIKDQERQAHH